MEKLAELVEEIDSLAIATGLGVASLTPGPAGQAGAVAAIAYDVKRKQWSGVALSAASMIPILGYAPAFFKVGLLVYQLDGCLKVLEQNEVTLHNSPESYVVLTNGLGKYYRKLPDLWVTRRLRKRLERILGVETLDQIALSGDPQATLEDNSSSTTTP